MIEKKEFPQPEVKTGDPAVLAGEPVVDQYLNSAWPQRSLWQSWHRTVHCTPVGRMSTSLTSL